MLAHQGGWDEMLLVLGPILVIAGLLMLAERRVERNAISPATHGQPRGANTDAHDPNEVDDPNDPNDRNEVDDTKDIADGSSA